MKKTTLFVLGLMACMAGYAQEATNATEKNQTVLAKITAKRWQGTPILQAFGIPSGNIGFVIDSALMTRDFTTLLEMVEYLDSLEQAKQVKSSYIDAQSLLDTTAKLLIRLQPTDKQAETGLAFVFALRFGLTEEITKQLEKMLNTGSTPPPPPPPPPPPKTNPAFRAKGAPKTAAAAKPSGPMLKVVNNSSKNLYLYVEDEYKGIVYAGKEFQLRGVAGCHQVIVESLDQFRSAKKYCFNTTQSGDWVITNN